MNDFPALRFAVGLTILLVLMLGQAVLPPAPDSPLWSATLDAGHVPLFGLVAYLVLRLSLASFPRWKPRLWHYGLAFVVTAAVGFLTEGAQMFVARNANLMDQERNLLGGAAALLLSLAVDRELFGSRDAWRHALRAGAVMLVVVAWIPPTMAAVSYLERNAAFPQLCGFEHGWEMRFTRLRDADLEVTDPPPGWRTAQGDHVGKITFEPAWYPALALKGIYPDWSGYDRLAFDVFSTADTTLTIAVRIDDADHDETYQDRFQQEIAVRPGATAVTISLEKVRQAPRGRSMDLSRMRNVTLFAVHPERPFSVYVDAFRLERN